MPVQYIAWLRGTTFHGHLADVTGLSRSRVSNTSQKLRPGKELQIRQHSGAVHRSVLTDVGLSESDIELVQERLRGLEAAGGQAWARFWTAVDYQVEPELTTCVEAAVQLDRLLSEVGLAAEVDKPADARNAFIAFLQAWNVPSEIALSEGPGLTHSDWQNVDTWKQVFALADRLLLTAFVDQFAHVDAVWGNSFFQRLQARPVFSLVAPKRRGERRVNMPVRRLLQLSYALNHWARYRTWPAKAPQAADLAKVLEVRSDDVSNLFDGTTKLHFRQFESRWPRFGGHFGLRQAVSFPSPLAAIAICWQYNLVTRTPEHKLCSFLLLGPEYEELWRWRRQGVATQSTGSESWAAWLDD